MWFHIVLLCFLRWFVVCWMCLIGYTVQIMVCEWAAAVPIVSYTISSISILYEIWYYPIVSYAGGYGILDHADQNLWVIQFGSYIILDYPMHTLHPGMISGLGSLAPSGHQPGCSKYDSHRIHTWLTHAQYMINAWRIWVNMTSVSTVWWPHD